jgi:hypothetical protein
VLRMLTRMGFGGAGDVDTAAFATLKAAAPQPVGIYLDSETTGISAMRQILASIGAALLPGMDGRFTVYRFTGLTAPEAVLTQRDIIGDSFGLGSNLDTDGGQPASGIKLKWGYNYRTHSESDIAGYVTEVQPNRAAALRQEWREVVVPVAGVAALHPLAVELEVETLLTEEADASAEAARLAALYGVDRYVTQVTVTRERAEECPLNSTVTLYPDVLIDAGRDMVVIGQDHDLTAETVSLTLWG